ncbi:MAG: transporter permease subunit [Hyphomicrobiales bacterium]|nr:transporter permease subunit [Hyphomicrobiales bacterium]
MSGVPPLSRLRRLVLGLPALWLVLFFLAPFVLVAKISLSQAALSQPPYAPAFALADGFAGVWEKAQGFSLAAYGLVFDDDIYVAAYLSSLRLAALATLATLLIAFPLAWAMTKAPGRVRPALVLLAIAPFWTSFLIRIYAWIMILKDEGLLNHALMSLGLIDAPLPIFASDWAVLIGIVYSYLPFMVLPLYTALDRLDPALLEAAADLGATPARAFRRIVLPLARPGIIAGVLLVFIPAVGEFVIPDLLGGSDTLMIGRTLWTEFFENRDWPAASAVAIILLALLLVPLVIYERMQIREAAR